MTLSKLLQAQFLGLHRWLGKQPQPASGSIPWALSVCMILVLEGWEDCGGFCILFLCFLQPDPCWTRFKDDAERNLF